ncbi:MAG: glycoside hydrolase family 97 catalytic domain-containing protein [Prevotellaceae bacterium]|nr:glycoside hydrolase family 97 catalytic domain-containing protein [Prevotellaceae bacterium]
MSSKHTLLVLLGAALIAPSATKANTYNIGSPDGKLLVSIDDSNGKLFYTVNYEGKEMLKPSQLGLKTDMGDYTQDLKVTNSKEEKVSYSYTMTGTKASNKTYEANALNLETTSKTGKRSMTIEIQVSNNNIAYRYKLGGALTKDRDEPRRTTILEEVSGFNFPDATTTFVCPQIDGDHKGWMSTKPSYEEEYKADAPMAEKSRYGKGYTFPCLFHVGDAGWVLVSETGVGSNYCGSHLSDYNPNAGYTIAFPDVTEQHGLGSTTPAISLPGSTPWRTITVGSTLKPIAETTISYDVVEEMYPAREEYKPGRYTWSWLIWQDNSINYKDQKEFIDVAAAMGFEYCLVDGFWDETIGRDKIAELSKYAQSKGVHLLLWYNSNGYANDAPQTPRNCMNTSIAREKEMAWMESIGIKGIKVDFFGGDKQQTMQLYEDLLSDANRHGLQVIFHGCTLPRGWEKMYPNFVASEAVLASENVYFNEHHAKREGFELTMHPFCRNTVASMDWGGSIMNRFLSKDNKSRHKRYTSDTFEMASAIMNQTSIQCICMQKSNLTELEQFEMDFLKAVPTTWDETMYIDGYPTKHSVMARRHGDNWYVAGLNGEDTAKTLTINLPMFAGKEVTFYTDAAPKKGSIAPLTPVKKTIKVDKKGNAKITLQALGGIIITDGI